MSNREGAAAPTAIAVFVLLSVLYPEAAYAQGQGTISGLITDASGRGKNFLTSHLEETQHTTS
jgi:hypothetical protein